jgi:tripartite-type tricarboxylate transporter receptor subunit TctC
MFKILRLAAFAVLPVLLAGAAWAADSYPSRAVKLIVPFGAGGPADVYARVLAQHLSEETKQSFVVEDRPGAGSIIGTDAVGRLISKAGGKLIGYYLTFGEYDFLSIAEVPNDTQMAAVLLAAGSSGGVTDVRTTVAMTSVEAKGAFAAASDLAPGFKSAGGA